MGVQNGGEVYNETMNLSAAPGKSANLKFPSFRPTNAGDINLTATINDGNADNDSVAAVTKVTQ
jgi:hypothetical protein